MTQQEFGTKISYIPCDHTVETPCNATLELPIGNSPTYYICNSSGLLPTLDVIAYYDTAGSSSNFFA